MTGVEPGACEQEALFDIEGPDEDGCVWAKFANGTVENMGPRDAVLTKFADFFGDDGVTALDQADDLEERDDFGEPARG